MRPARVAVVAAMLLCVASAYGQAPDPPGSVTATAGAYVDKIRVGWTAVTGATKYFVYRNTTDNQSTALQVQMTSATTFDDINVEQGYDYYNSTPLHTYYYWVRTYDGAAFSGFSHSANGYANGPAAPQNFAASNAQYMDRIRLTWDPVSGATSYIIYRRRSQALPTDSTAEQYQLTTTAATTYDDLSARLGSTYYYALKASNGKAESDFSSSASGSLTDGKSLSAPGSVSATDGTYFDRVRVTWSAPATAKVYYVYRGATSTFVDAAFIGTVWGIDNTTFDDLGAGNSPGTTFYYWVKAYNGVVFSSESSSNTGYAAQQDIWLESGTPVSGLSGGVGSEVNYGIAVPTGAVSLEIKTTGGPGDCDLYVKWGDKPSTSSYDYRPYLGGCDETVTVSNPRQGAWYIMVRGYKAYQDVTLVATFSTATDASSVPSNVSATDGTLSDRVRVTWNGVDGATAYEVYRGESDNTGAATRLRSVAAPTTSFDDTTAHANITYYYWVVAVTGSTHSAYSASDSGYLGEVEVTWLQNAVPIQGINGEEGSYKYYAIHVPPAQDSLTITMSGGSGDADLYVQLDQKPTRSYYEMRDISSGNNATFTITYLTDQVDYVDYYILIYGYREYLGVTLEAKYLPGDEPPDSHSSTLPPPDNVSASDGTYAGKIEVSWEPVEKSIEFMERQATGYSIYRSTTEDSSTAEYVGSKTVGDTPAPVVRFDDETVEVGRTYYYWVKAYNQWQTSRFSSSDSGYASEDTVTWLTNEVALTELSATTGSETYYAIAVPDDATSLKIEISGGMGDCDLYVKYGQMPTYTEYDYRPYKSGNAEGVKLDKPLPGEWFIMLRAYRTYSDLTLLAMYELEGGGRLDPPTNVAATDGTYPDKVKVTWDASAGATSYLVFRSTTNNSTASTQIGESSEAYAYDTTAAASTYYWYWVKAVNTDETSTFSDGDSGYAGAAPYIELDNGVTLADLSATRGDETFYNIVVPQGATTLEIKIWGGSGDCDLYVRQGLMPTTSQYDYRPYRSGSNETVTVSNPQSGDWFIMLRAYKDYSGVSLQATH